MSTSIERVPVEPSWPQGGFSFTREVDERNWTVNQNTGYVAPDNSINNWERGQLMRQANPQMRPPFLGLYAYDPTDPASWRQGGG